MALVLSISQLRVMKMETLFYIFGGFDFLGLFCGLILQIKI
jgi:hypothetical protein